MRQLGDSIHPKSLSLDMQTTIINRYNLINNLTNQQYLFNFSEPPINVNKYTMYQPSIFENVS